MECGGEESGADGRLGLVSHNTGGGFWQTCGILSLQVHFYFDFDKWP